MVDITCDLWELIRALDYGIENARECDAFTNICTAIYDCEESRTMMRVCVPGELCIAILEPESMFSDYADALHSAGHIAMSEKVRCAERKIRSFIKIDELLDGGLLTIFQSLSTNH